MTMYLAFCVLALTVQFWAVECTLWCLQCTKARNISECVTEVPCGQDKKCFTATSGHLGDRFFTLGCKSEQECNGVAPATGLIGRRATDTNCHQCCAQDRCNARLCSNFDHVTVSSGEVCKDSPGVNCSHLSSFTPICADVDHAKLLCKSWCGFCTIVDGQWNQWSTWSSCSVTCADGHMTRTRSCTDPKPSHGGHDCIGSKLDTLACHHSTVCPVNGGWGDWLSWQPCSVTCGAGLRRRERLCNNPAPAHNGQGCYGDIHDYEACSVTTCVINGGWSAWLPWEQCSTTCGVGMRRRERNCTNPAPANNGKDCHGDTHDYSICTMPSCDPKMPNVSFYITGVTNSNIVQGGKVVYRTTVWDTSGGYDNSTGVFTAPVTGLYIFTVTASVYTLKQVGLKIATGNGTGKLGELFIYDQSSYPTSSMTGMGELQAGSQVWIQCIYVSQYRGNTLYDSPSTGNENMFQGALVRTL